MSIKLASNKVPSRIRPKVPRDEFLTALRDMKVGQSFQWEMSAYDRMALSVAMTLLDRNFVTRKDGENGKRRIWRVK